MGEPLGDDSITAEQKVGSQSTEWCREKTLRPGVSREGLTAGHWATPLVGGVFAFDSIGERWS